MSRPTDYIPFFRPQIGVEEEQAVLRVLRSGWLTTAGEARSFEEEFAGRVGAAEALAVSSATAGLHLSLEALGVKPGQRVITTPYTFTATAEVISYLGADPLFVDIEEESCNLSTRRLEQTLEQEEEVAAILPVHLGGLPCDMEGILDLAEKRRIPVIEDAAHAFLAEIKGRQVGTFGHTGVFSFYATKPITTGEGGMVITDREDLAHRMRMMRLHGIDREVWDRYISKRASWSYQVMEAGFKYNMPDLAAAIGRVQLRKAEDFLRERERIARSYLEGLAGLDYLNLPPVGPENIRQAWHLFMIRLNEKRLTLSRDHFVEKLQEEGIGVSVHYIPLHIMPYYRNRYGYRPKDFPVALANSRRTFSLPIYPGLIQEQVERVIRTVRRIGSRYYRNSQLVFLNAEK